MAPSRGVNLSFAARSLRVLATAFFLAGLLPSYWPAIAAPVVREQHTIIVNGQAETWQLVWAEPPSSVCGVEDLEGAVTCPCGGFTYGEGGHLFVVRLKNGKEIEKLNLGKFFDASEHPTGPSDGLGYVQHWPQLNADFERIYSKKLTSRLSVSEIKRRPPTTVMSFADYDHDGRASEFLVRVGNVSCGHAQFIAVGVSATNGKLHALSSVKQPNQPLVMDSQQWEALLADPGPHTVPTWLCGDHGSEVYEDSVVSARDGKIKVTDRRHACTANGQRGKFIDSTER